jgi:hypothetical protein
MALLGGRNEGARRAGRRSSDVTQRARADWPSIKSQARLASACSNADSIMSRSCCCSPWEIATLRQRPTARGTRARVFKGAVGIQAEFRGQAHERTSAHSPRAAPRLRSANAGSAEFCLLKRPGGE